MIATSKQIALSAPLTFNQIVGLSNERFADYRAEQRLSLIDSHMVHRAGEFIEDVFAADKPLQRELKELQAKADAGEFCELDYETDVDVTAESCVPNVVVVGHVRWNRDRFAVVVECSTGMEKVGGRLVKKYVGRVCR